MMAGGGADLFIKKEGRNEATDPSSSTLGDPNFTYMDH